MGEVDRVIAEEGDEIVLGDIDEPLANMGMFSCSYLCLASCLCIV